MMRNQSVIKDATTRFMYYNENGKIMVQMFGGSISQFQSQNRLQDMEDIILVHSYTQNLLFISSVAGVVESQFPGITKSKPIS